MKAFRDNERVLVCTVDRAGVLPEPVPGTVTRIRRDGGAWVRLDTRLDLPNAHPFPADDARANAVLTYPEWCRKLPRAR